MSLYSNNEFIISSNNSMNDNTYNSMKANKTYKIKSILKPLLKMLRRNKNRTNKYMSNYQDDDMYCTECSDNSSNEDLESEIIDEMQYCPPDSAIFAIDEEGNWNLTPVTKGQTTVPVHFARTSAGTFFWTSMRMADHDVSPAYHCYTECQQPCQQQPIIMQDRWVQA